MTAKKRILITGSNGFVGQELIRNLDTETFELVLFERGDDLGKRSSKFENLDCVVHLAGKAHDRSATWEDFERDNVRLTSDLVETVRRFSPTARFLFVSSAKVYGENSQTPFSEKSKPEPDSLYGKSKLMAEELVQKSGLTYIILRPTLIYSSNAKGNLQSLRRISKLGIPLPSNIRNRRSLASLDFVVQKISSALLDQLKWNEIYNVCNITLTTSEIFKLNGVTWLMPYPKLLFHLLPRKFKQKLLFDLELTNSKILGRSS